MLAASFRFGALSKALLNGRAANQIRASISVRYMCDAAESSSSSTSRLHSTDIAFKPAESGWGGSKTYSEKWEKIFGAEKTKKETTATSSPSEWSENLERIKDEIDALSRSERETLLKSLS